MSAKLTRLRAPLRSSFSQIIAIGALQNWLQMMSPVAAKSVDLGVATAPRLQKWKHGNWGGGGVEP